MESTNAFEHILSTDAALREELEQLREWKAIVLGTGTDREAVIRMAAAEYTKTAVQCWKDENAKLRQQVKEERDTWFTRWKEQVRVYDQLGRKYLTLESRLAELAEKLKQVTQERDGLQTWINSRKESLDG